MIDPVKTEEDLIRDEGLPQSNAAAVVSLLSIGSIPYVEVKY